MGCCVASNLIHSPFQFIHQLISDAPQRKEEEEGHIRQVNLNTLCFVSFAIFDRTIYLAVPQFVYLVGLSFMFSFILICYCVTLFIYLFGQLFMFPCIYFLILFFLSFIQQEFIFFVYPFCLILQSLSFLNAPLSPLPTTRLLGKATIALRNVVHAAAGTPLDYELGLLDATDSPTVGTLKLIVSYTPPAGALIWQTRYQLKGFSSF